MLTARFGSLAATLRQPTTSPRRPRMSQMKTFPRPVASNDHERKPGSRGGLLLMLTLYSNPKWLSVARCRSITRAVDEALTNIVRHSYSNRFDQPIAMYFRRAQRRHDGKFSKGSKSCFVTAVPQLTRASFKGGFSKKYAPADWDCTSFNRPWTPLSSPARVQRIGCASLSIWPTEAVFS